MFTWICPKCKREVPPSYDECPDCAARERGEERPAEAPAAAAAPPAPAPKAAPARRGGLPTWLMSVLFALGFIALGVGAYLGVNAMRQRGAAAAEEKRPAPMLENAGQNKGKPHPLQRYIEVSGVRFLQDAKKRTEVRFVLVNHSPDTISDLAGTVTIWGRTQKSDEEAVGTFAFKVPLISAWESKEMSAVVDTKLRVYELPDWQNVTAEVQLTGP